MEGRTGIEHSLQMMQFTMHLGAAIHVILAAPPEIRGKLVVAGIAELHRGMENLGRHIAADIGQGIEIPNPALKVERHLHIISTSQPPSG